MPIVPIGLVSGSRSFFDDIPSVSVVGFLMSKACIDIVGTTAAVSFCLLALTGISAVLNSGFGLQLQKPGKL
jgi:hypothetical protein